MKLFRFTATGVLLLFSTLLLAHGPTPKKADQSIEINVSVDKVWAQLKAFDGMADWHPLVTESSGDGSHTAGTSQRTLTLKKGQLVEELTEYLDAEYEYSYRLVKENTDAFPVSSYRMTIKVNSLPDDKDKSSVHWKGRFYRGDTGNFPTEKLNDEAAIKAMGKFFTKGLQGLKDTVESKPTETLSKHKVDEQKQSDKRVKENTEDLPIDAYRVTINVESLPEGENSVHWTGQFYRGDSSNFPSETVTKTMDEFIIAGLQALKDNEAEVSPEK